jgi:penicillin-binding protein 1A
MVTSLHARLDDLQRRWLVARQTSPRLVAIATLIVAGAMVLSVGVGSWGLVSAFRGLPDLNAVRRIGNMDQATSVFDGHDNFAFTIFRERRIEVSLSGISPNLVRAIVATEDQRFYEHHGFDLLRIGSAAFANIRHRRVAQGGSTITQQLARQSFLRPDKTFRRKFQELILAERIEQLFTKQQILELYLNKVYFGDGLYGAEAASRGYFGKHASELSVSEAAVLAGLVKSPSSYAPTVNPSRAVVRRNVVLQAMLDAGAIDRKTWQAARATPLKLKDTLRADEPHGQYFKEQVRRELVERFGWQRVYQSGLRVFSTIDMPMQIAAESVVAESLKELESRRNAIAARRSKVSQPQGVRRGERLQAALISLDPITGHVRAMIGGRDFDESHFNRAVQAHRQPGSAFKPFVYATALEAGYTPATILDHLDDPIVTVQGAWMPEDEHSTASAMSLRTGLRTSSNRAAVRLLQQVGISRTVQYAKQMGIGDVPSVPSLALGSGEVTLQSMTAAYASFANHGLVPSPLTIRRVEDQDGLVLYQAQESSTPAISETTAFLMSTMLADVVNAGTAAGARRLGFTLPAAGKTGTTNDFNDAWFVGFTPKLVTGVWVGFDQPHTILPNGFAATIAVPIWAKFMKIATRGDAPQWFTPPAGVTTAKICRISGKLASPGCNEVEVVDAAGQIDRRSMVYTEYFVRGTEPTTYCDIHPEHHFLAKMASFLGIGVDKPPPPPVRVSELPPPAPISTAQVEVSTGPIDVPPAAEPEPKRGFWSRIFRRHDKSDKQ